MRLEVAKEGDIAPGGMKFVIAGGREIVVCNRDGRYHALDRRCGHMNGPLEMGALDGPILTCPMHHVQFDVTTGHALNGPVPESVSEPLPDGWARYMRYLGVLMAHTSVCNIRTFPVTTEHGAVHIDID